MIVQNDQDVPFDLNQIRNIRYLPNEEGLKELKGKLWAFIQASRTG